MILVVSPFLVLWLVLFGGISLPSVVAVVGGVSLISAANVLCGVPLLDTA